MREDAWRRSSRVHVSWSPTQVQALLLAGGAHARLASQAIISAQASRRLKARRPCWASCPRPPNEGDLKLLLAQIERVVMTTP